MIAADRFSLDGRVALVTGGGRGIGRALALGLAEAGADVCVGGRGGGLEDVVAEARRMGHRAVAVTADLSDPSQAANLAQEAERRLGPVDILVNNAGLIHRSPLLDYQEADWDAVMNLNLKSVFLLSQAVARGMRERRRGKIIQIASLLSYQGGLNVAAYAASKGAVGQLTKAMANELAPHGVNVNAIVPGYIVTDGTAALVQDAARNRQITDRIPAGRWGQPEDLVGACIFLASAASDFVHGTLLPVDGGWLGR